jgi:deazaflavin-dependent oxidoreductase (nitroreductase family)
MYSPGAIESEQTIMSLDPRLENQLRRGFKGFNRFMLLLWHLGLGPWVNWWPAVGGQIMVITHTGRKTGAQRRTPVNYTLIDGDLYCTAGFGHISDWYRNILANPQVQVWLPDGWWAGTAEDISAEPQRLAILRQVLIASGFAAYLAGVNPRQMSDAELHRLTQSYRLVRIRRAQARTGPGGPGELAWVWPLATFALLGLLLRRRKADF